MRVLVTGGAGFIGSHTVDALLGRGYEVRILDNLQKPVHLKGKPKYLPKAAEFVFGDVRDKRMLEYALAGMDVVYHFAAYQDYLPDFSTYFHVNAVSTALIYEIIVEKKLPMKKVIVASSQAVLGEGIYECLKCKGESEKRKEKDEKGGEKRIKGQNISDCGLRMAESGIAEEQRADGKGERLRGQKFHLEDWEWMPDIRVEEQLAKGDWEHKCPRCGEVLKYLPTPEEGSHPQNQYALSKISEEGIAINLGRRYGIPSVGMRYSIVQGPRQSFYNAYSGANRIFSLSLYLDKAPTIYEDGLQVRDYVNIEDVVLANLLVLDKDEANYEVYNVGSGRAYTVLEFYNIVRREFNKDVAPVLPNAYRYGDTRHIFSDIRKLAALGWKPRFTPEKSVRDYRQYLEEQTDVEDILVYAEAQMKKMNVVRRAR